MATVHGGYGLPSSSDIQDTYSSVKGSDILSCQWAQGLVVKLLETTHGQLLYRCIQVHNKVAGTCIIAYKEEIQHKIERQLKLGMEDLLDVDQYLAEVNTNDLESGSGEHATCDLCCTEGRLTLEATTTEPLWMDTSRERACAFILKPCQLG
jgi:hypothetical protein